MPARIAQTMEKPKLREWSPRIWEGCDAFAYLELLARNRFAVEFPYWYIAGICSVMSCVNTGLRWFQRGLYGDRVDATRITHAPIFVLGHWRTGTTLLHELLILDDRHAYPNTHACTVPCHVLLSEDFFKRFLWFLTPDKRPVDNMPAGWDRPQECEFALALLGEPGTYKDFAFPNRPPLHPGSLDQSSLTPSQFAKWKRTFMRFLKEITLKDPRRLVLKSPPHTARIPALLDMFPDARFVHLVRNPYSLFVSTVNLWTRLAKTHGLQTPRSPQAIEEKVFHEFRVLHEKYEATKSMIPAGRLVELKYEDLTSDIVGQTRKIYEGLELGEFETVEPKILQYQANNRNYETNKYQLTPELKARIRDRWGDLIEKLGYPVDS
ncbi:MAG: sulfotransferase [Gemmataceae bacterium]